MEFEINLHISRILFQKDSSFKCRFCTKGRASSRLVSEAWANIKMFQPKYWNFMQEQDQVNRILRFVSERYRKTDQRKINIRKQQFNIISGYDFCFQFWMLLLLALKRVTQRVTKYMIRKAFKSYYGWSITVSF